jgi:hypothetical protein
MIGFHRPKAKELATAVSTPFPAKDLLVIPFADFFQETIHPLDQCQIPLMALVHEDDLAEISDLVKEGVPREGPIFASFPRRNVIKKISQPAKCGLRCTLRNPARL